MADPCAAHVESDQLCQDVRVESSQDSSASQRSSPGLGTEIGRACAHRLAAEGARVAAADLDLAAAESVVGEFPDDSAPLAIAMDVTKTPTVNASFDEATLSRAAGCGPHPPRRPRSLCSRLGREIGGRPRRDFRSVR